jgi:hypothetical protein
VEDLSTRHPAADLAHPRHHSGGVAPRSTPRASIPPLRRSGRCNRRPVGALDQGGSHDPTTVSHQQSPPIGPGPGVRAARRRRRGARSSQPARRQPAADHRPRHRPRDGVGAAHCAGRDGTGRAPVRSWQRRPYPYRLRPADHQLGPRDRHPCARSKF